MSTLTKSQAILIGNRVATGKMRICRIPTAHSYWYHASDTASDGTPIRALHECRAEAERRCYAKRIAANLKNPLTFPPSIKL